MDSYISSHICMFDAAGFLVSDLRLLALMQI